MFHSVARASASLAICGKDLPSYVPLVTSDQDLRKICLEDCFCSAFRLSPYGTLGPFVFFLSWFIRALRCIRLDILRCRMFLTPTFMLGLAFYLLFLAYSPLLNYAFSCSCLSSPIFHISHGSQILQSLFTLRVHLTLEEPRSHTLRLGLGGEYGIGIIIFSGPSEPLWL